MEGVRNPLPATLKNKTIISTRRKNVWPMYVARRVAVLQRKLDTWMERKPPRRESTVLALAITVMSNGNPLSMEPVYPDRRVCVGTG